MKKLIALILALVLALGLTGCAATAHAADLMAELTPGEAPQKAPDEAFTQNQMALALKLFTAMSQENQGENILISPLSIQLALGMTANGASGQTREEMQALLGGAISLEDLNEYLAGYLASLPSQEKAKLHIANSIWFRDGEAGIDVQPEFLKLCQDVYQAQAYAAPFDAQTVRDINGWVKENTQGMIEKLVGRLGSETMMCLINALAFDAKWQSIYTSDDVIGGIFTARGGKAQEAELMYSEEYSYLQLENATGFLKNYAGGSYRFAALLPEEGLDIYEFIATLSPQALFQVLQEPQNILVKTWLPKFTSEYCLTMNDVLSELGMPTAFDSGLADFSGISNTPLYISEVIHKTYISVDEEGTRAAAVTSVMMNECAAMIPEDFRTVRLDRPFVYMILDGNNLPLFIGITNQIQE